jgi:hypothetical protein
MNAPFTDFVSIVPNWKTEKLHCFMKGRKAIRNCTHACEVNGGETNSVVRTTGSKGKKQTSLYYIAF